MDHTTPSAQAENTELRDLEGRRDVVRKLGKFAAYAAPFTLLASNVKAASGSGFGGGPQATPAARRR